MARNSIYPASVQPGIPKLGDKPSGWFSASYAQVLELVQRPIKLEDNCEYQLVIAKRNRGGIVGRGKVFGKEIKTESQYLTLAGDFLISKRQIVHGACGIVPPELDGSVVSGEYLTLLPKANLTLDYLKYLSHSVYFQQTCFHASVGIDVEKMIFRLEEWLGYEIYLPPPSEQRAIATILGTWEDAITVTQALIEALQTRKQSLMQRLLTRQVRFPGFNEEWEEKKLADFLTLQLRKIEKPDATYKRLGIRSHGKGIFITEDADPDDITMEHLYEVKENDLIVNITFAWEGAIALVEKCHEGGLVSHRFPTYEFDTSKVIPQFFKYLALTQEFFFRLGLISPGGAGRNRVLSKTDFLKLEVKTPSVEEQRRIANIFEATQKQIMRFGDYLAKLKEQKHGLMQQLLTGQIRVKVD